MKKLYLTFLYAVTLAALCAATLQAQLEERRLVRELAGRSQGLAAALDESVQMHVSRKNFLRLERLAERLAEKQRLSAIVICGAVPRVFGVGARDIHPVEACQAGTHHVDAAWKMRFQSHPYLLHAHTMETTLPAGIPTMVLVQDLDVLRAHWFSTLMRAFAVAWFAGLALGLLIASQLGGWITAYLRFLYQSLKGLATGHRPMPPSAEQLLRHESELAALPRAISQISAKILALPVRRSHESQAKRTPENAIAEELRSATQGRRIVVFANREPYIHQRKSDEQGDRVEVLRPASGLVTALEPILRIGGGLWVGHGSGSADRETVDANNEVRVPPGNPSYTLKRVWLTEAEEQGYYYGFSNEGLWPLCHLAHTRPTFRLSDWESYRKVNQRFCDETTESVFHDGSLILVQDYHFALLPRMLKERANAANIKNPEYAPQQSPKISLFWHIPWPNPEAFGICPWNEELLRGMLGADVLGFHTQYHCNNFLETCDRFLEARIDWENFTVTMENHTTRVRAFPIGIETAPVRGLADEERVELKKKYGINAEIVAVGVDRIDYTKGLIERVEAVERFLEKNPEYVGRFTLVQMGSPSRTHIPAYAAFNDQLAKVVERINTRFDRPGLPEGYKPIVFLPHHHEWSDIQYFYQIGDVCMVTSLHDGMNLVAKEYVWCQRPDRGSLILSRFTGASRELSEALLVNPYSIEEMADALATAVKMPATERARRMLSMRSKIEGHNAFHWAADLIRALVDEGARPASSVAAFRSIR